MSIPNLETTLKQLRLSASAILDRFLHHARTIAITGRSYRLKEATRALARRGRGQVHQGLMSTV